MDANEFALTALTLYAFDTVMSQYGNCMLKHFSTSSSLKLMSV